MFVSYISFNLCENLDIYMIFQSPSPSTLPPIYQRPSTSRLLTYQLSFFYPRIPIWIRCKTNKTNKFFFPNFWILISLQILTSSNILFQTRAPVLSYPHINEVTPSAITIPSHCTEPWSILRTAPPPNNHLSRLSPVLPMFCITSWSQFFPTHTLMKPQ